jgi:hypothetical protein
VSFVGTLAPPVFVVIAWRQRAFGLIGRLYFIAFSFAAMMFAGWLSQRVGMNLP